MARTPHAPAADLRGLSRLTIDAIAGIVGLVEAMHSNIASVPGMPGKSTAGRTTGITGLVYRSINGAIGLAGHGLDRLLAKLNPLLVAGSAWPGRESVLAALNGVLGDYLAASNNPLAITMSLRRDGNPLPMDREALVGAIPQATGRVAILVHGLCLNDLQWKRQGHDHGAALARDLGYTPVYLHYNTGLHISVNGRAFADLLESLLRVWPVLPLEVVIVGHSMGGLVTRSAFHYGAVANHDWPRHVGKVVFLGTPHHGAPLERGGNLVDMLLGISRYTAPFARLGKIRSAGITDLRYGSLVDEDWKGRDRFERTGDVRLAVPLPEGVEFFTIAATAGNKAGGLGDRLIGDGIVPLASALGRHRDPGRALQFPDSRQWVGASMTHLELLHRREVYARMKEWLAPPE
ncbi:MAG: alpha/beta hydrolase [Betaproteobacteria bacterium]